MAKPHQRIRTLMDEHDINSQTLAEELGIDTSTMSRKLMGRTPWTSDQMWRIMDIFHLPPREFHLVFPKGGASAAR